MIYRKYKPSAALTPYVECYFIWESVERIEEVLMVESPPNGYCSFVFNYGDPYKLQNSKYNELKVPMQFMSGQSIYSYKLSLIGNIGITGIIFKPAALGTIFQFPMFEYVEERIDLRLLFSKELIDRYSASIRSATNETQRVQLLEDFITDQIDRLKPNPDYIDLAANQIIETNGMLHINEMLINSCMCRRSFERKFFRKVGLSPKYYARIRRIGYICNLIAGKKEINWTKILYELEFYDQAHFIKDFEEFTGRSPSLYMKLNSELVRHVEKPVLLSIPVSDNSPPRNVALLQ